jgi:alginate O-acetyltransferase complex protein AlgI
MLFNSFEFLILLAITLVLYYVPIPGRWARVWQVGVLLSASSIFYGWEDPRLLLLLGLSCFFNAVSVERILSAKREDRPVVAKRWLVGSIVLNLCFLAFFKYAGILLSIVPGVHPAAVDWARAIPLPIGISFYTFHAISLLVDVHRGTVSQETQRRLGRKGTGRAASMGDLSLYIVFFPQLVAGPIIKAHDFVNQIREKLWRNIDWTLVRRYLITGYFLKIFVADNLAEQSVLLTVDASLRTSGPISLMAMLYGYGLQIFADFAGYSLIAIGLGMMFGYRLPENFRFPYLSLSITEFWRRWHLSLSSWLREYLYIPLGGNRKGSGRTYFNLFLVMFLGGLWHGAEWKFALWGTLHDGLLAFERLVFRSRAGSFASTGPWRWLRDGFRWAYAFHAVMFLWLTFLMPDMAHIRLFFEMMGSGDWSVKGQPVFALLVYGGMVVLYHLWGWLQEHRPYWVKQAGNPWAEGIIHAVMLFLIITNPGAPRGFIYFQF